MVRIGAPGWIRTSDPRLRSASCYLQRIRNSYPMPRSPHSRWVLIRNAGLDATDKRYRPSLSSDLVKSVRAFVDRVAFELPRERESRRREVVETSWGICRHGACLARELRQHSGALREAVGLLKAPDLPTPATRRRRSTSFPGRELSGLSLASAGNGWSVTRNRAAGGRKVLLTQLIGEEPEHGPLECVGALVGVIGVCEISFLPRIK